MNPAEMSAVILAGGESSRMGKNKLLLPLGDKPLIGHLLATLGGLFAESILVTDQPASFQQFPVRVTEDLICCAAKNSLVGIHAGLTVARFPYILAVAGDMPFVKKELLLFLCAQVRGEDVIIIKDGPHFQPLCAIYHKNCLPQIEKLLRAGRYKIADFYNLVNVREVDVRSVQHIDPQGRSFFNVNTPQDYETALQIYRENDVCD